MNIEEDDGDATEKKQVTQKNKKASKATKASKDSKNPKPKKSIKPTKTKKVQESKSGQAFSMRLNVFGFLENDKVRGYIILGTKIVLALLILIFVVMLFKPWFTLTGTAPERGIIRIEESMKPDFESTMIFYDEEKVFERVADFSPMSLVGYALSYRDTYKQFTDSEGTSGTSTFARLHLFYIWLFIIVIGGAVISIMLLIIGTDYQFMHIVRSIGLMTLGIVALNFVSLKIPFFSMFAIRVQSILNIEYPSEIARLTQNGIASGDVSYTYGLELLSTFKTVIIFLGLWIILAAIFGEIKNKMDDSVLMNEE
jgi:hypothetical protein